MIYQCPKCLVNFKENTPLQRHLNRKRPCHIKNVYKCTCLREFKRKSDYTRHINRLTPCSLEETLKKLSSFTGKIKNTKIYKCTKCPKEFDTKSKYKRHMNIKTSCADYKICECGEILCNNSQVTRHFSVNFNKGPINCDICEISYVSLCGLQQHFESNDHYLQFQKLIQPKDLNFSEYLQ